MILRRMVSCLVLVLLAGAEVPGGAAELPVADGQQQAGALAAVERHAFVSVSAAELADEDARRQADGLPYRFALPVDVAFTPDNSGTWEVLGPDRLLWRLRLASPGALSLNLGFARAEVPANGRLLVYPTADPAAARRLDREVNARHGEVWTPAFVGDELVVELVVAREDRALVELEIASLGRGYRFFGEDPVSKDFVNKSGSCNVDVVCPAGDPWRQEIDTVGLLQRSGSVLCTGFMVNNTEADGRPLFMTAFHCSVNLVSAPSLVVYWNYHSPTCGQHGGGDLTQTSIGSTFLAGYVNSDFSLVELDEVPAPQYGVKYAGWNRSSADPDSAVCVHHPSLDEKSISFERDPLTTTGYLSATPAPATGDHLRVADWDLGTTEGGSSGSPLFDPQHRVVGQLHGGQAGCGNNLSDWYGRLSVSWEGGGAPNNRLRDHLDPVGSGAMTADLYIPPVKMIAVTPAGGTLGTGVPGGPFTLVDNLFRLTNAGAGDVNFTASSEAEWVWITPSGGVLAEGAQTELTVSLTEAADSLHLGVHRAVIDLVNPEGGGSTTRELVLTITENSISLVGVAPNPVTRPPVTITYNLRGPAPVTAEVHDLRGQLVQTLGPFSGTPGTNTIEWHFRDSHGARAAAGLYIVTLKSLGKVLRTAVTVIP